MNEDKVVCKVYKNKTSKQKLVTIPRDSDIEDGEYVVVKKLEIK